MMEVLDGKWFAGSRNSYGGKRFGHASGLSIIAGLFASIYVAMP